MSTHHSDSGATTSLPTASLGATGLQVTGVGLGAWAIGGGDWQGGWGTQDDEDSIRAIQHAMGSGVNWVDAAPAYGLGHAEEVVGEAVRRLPAGDRPLVFTKCGLVWKPGERTVSNVLAPDSIRQECTDSLRRLGAEVIDLLQIHWPSDDGTPIQESWATMAALVDEGKVRYIGVSNFDTHLLDQCEAIRHVDTVQPQLNLLERGTAADVIPWAHAHRTGVLVYSPMRSGMLTGRFSAERVASLPDDDWRGKDPAFQEPELGRSLRLVESLKAIAGKVGCSLPELAVAWTLAWPGVSGAIVGARSPEQVDGWVGAAGVRLSDAVLDEIAGAVRDSGAGSGPERPEH
ncbi:MAG: aldo/keto reductase [Candidatus Dormibacteria bacterium]